MLYMPKKLTVILVDDQELIRQGVGALLKSCDNIEIIAEANCGEDAIVLIKEHHPNLCLMDIRMPGIGGLEAIRKISKTLPMTKVIALSSYDDNAVLHQVLESGATGFLTKGCDKSELLHAIGMAHAGRRYISSDLAQRVAFGQVNNERSQNSPFKNLSEREFQIMLMLTSGQKSCEISDKLCLSPKTVSTYRHRLLSKLNVTNDVELTHFALKHGALSLDTVDHHRSLNPEKPL